jgi:hypothetical protein
MVKEGQEYDPSTGDSTYKKSGSTGPKDYTGEPPDYKTLTAKRQWEEELRKRKKKTEQPKTEQPKTEPPKTEPPKQPTEPQRPQDEIDKKRIDDIVNTLMQAWQTYKMGNNATAIGPLIVALLLGAPGAGEAAATWLAWKLIKKYTVDELVRPLLEESVPVVDRNTRMKDWDRAFNSAGDAVIAFGGGLAGSFVKVLSSDEDPGGEPPSQPTSGYFAGSEGDELPDYQQHQIPSISRPGEGLHLVQEPAPYVDTSPVSNLRPKLINDAAAAADAATDVPSGGGAESPPRAPADDDLSGGRAESPPRAPADDTVDQAVQAVSDAPDGATHSAITVTGTDGGGAPPPYEAPTSSPEAGGGLPSWLVPAILTVSLVLAGGVAAVLASNNNVAQSVAELGARGLPAAPVASAGSGNTVQQQPQAVQQPQVSVSVKQPAKQPVASSNPTPKPNVVFSTPQYLIHATGHGTYSGGVKDDWWFLFPKAPTNNNIDLPDGSGGTFTYSTDYSSGPYTDANAVRAAAPAQLKGMTLSGWNRNNEDFTV